MFHYKFIICVENQGQSLIFRFSAEISVRVFRNFKIHFWCFRDIGLIKFSETLYSRSVALTGENVLHFYRLETT